MIDDLRQFQVRQRDAHFNRDASLMVPMFADDFVSVQDGEISRPSREASRERLERYFARVHFVAWDDIVDPVFEVSEDGTLATVLVHKRVHVTYRDADGEPAEGITIFAWVETWRRRNDQWELAMVVSTRKDDA